MALLALMLAGLAAPPPASASVASRRAAAYRCNAGARHWTPSEARCAVRVIWHGSRRIAQALRVAACESHFNAYRVEPGSHASGVWQIIPAYHRDIARYVFDPVRSSEWVRQVTRDGRNWSAWVCQ